MSNKYLIDIGMNDSLQDVIRKSNRNFRMISSDQTRQGRSELRTEIGNVDDALAAEAEARSQADFRIDEAIDDIRDQISHIDPSVDSLTDEEIDEIINCHCDPQWDDDAMGYYLDQVAQMLEEANVLPAGGTTNQVLAKASDADFDTIWTDMADDDAPIPNIDIDDIITMSDLGDL